MQSHDINDILAPNLRVIFCGINPGRKSAHTGYQFSHPGNRFWKTLYLAGFTERQLKPEEERKLLNSRCGLTVLVVRPTRMASELSVQELREGGKALTEKIRHFQPAALAVLGKESFRRAFSARNVLWGKQAMTIGNSEIWVLPNPSGLNRISQEKLAADWGALNEALKQRGI